MGSLETSVKTEVLARANGFCEDEGCNNELGDNFHFVYTKYRLMHPDTVMVICNGCYRRRRSLRRRIS